MALDSIIIDLFLMNSLFLHFVLNDQKDQIESTLLPEFNLILLILIASKLEELICTVVHLKIVYLSL